MKPHTFIFTFLFLSLSSVVFCQTQVNPTVISSAGAQMNNSNVSISWTLGEVITDQVSNSGNIISQGFQQPEFINTTNIEEALPLSISIYPNPTSDWVTITNKGIPGEFNIHVFDNLGKKVLSGSFDKLTYNLNVQNWESGTYHIIISNLTNQFTESIIVH